MFKAKGTAMYINPISANISICSTTKTTSEQIAICTSIYNNKPLKKPRQVMSRLFLIFAENLSGMDQPKLERLLRLMKLLTANTTYNVDQLAERLDMSRRTVYRYIDTFRERTSTTPTS